MLPDLRDLPAQTPPSKAPPVPQEQPEPLVQLVPQAPLVLILRFPVLLALLEALALQEALGLRDLPERIQLFRGRPDRLDRPERQAPQAPQAPQAQQVRPVRQAQIQRSPALLARQGLRVLPEQQELASRSLVHCRLRKIYPRPAMS